MGNPRAYQRRSLSYAIEFVRAMRRRGVSRGEMMKLLDEAEYVVTGSGRGLGNRTRTRTR